MQATFERIHLSLPILCLQDGETGRRSQYRLCAQFKSFSSKFLSVMARYEYFISIRCTIIHMDVMQANQRHISYTLNFKPSTAGSGRCSGSKRVRSSESRERDLNPRPRHLLSFSHVEAPCHQPMGRPHTHTLALCSQGVVYAPFGNGFGFSLHPRSMGDKKMIMKNDQTLYTNNTFFCSYLYFCFISSFFYNLA